MKEPLDEIREAFTDALDQARLRGLNWREHVRPFFRNGRIAGYYILDETFSTTIKTINIL